MLLRHGEARDEGHDRRLAATLAAVAGAINVAAFQAVGYYAANMTGNVSSASGEAAAGQFASAGFYLGIVATFIAGAAVSTLLIDSGRRRGNDGIYAHSILAEACLMAALGLADPALPPPWQGTLLVLGSSFLMGLQNAVVTRISGARVRTTHVSGMATDIGIGLGMLLDIAAGREPRSERPAIRARLGLHATTVAAFLAGGVLGALVYRAAGTWVLPICAAVLLVVALPATYRAAIGGRGS